MRLRRGFKKAVDEVFNDARAQAGAIEECDERRVEIEALRKELWALIDKLGELQETR